MIYLENCIALIESQDFIMLEFAAMSEPLYLAKSEDGYPALLPQMANRHGLITGATGTGKTVTLQSMAERLSYAGVPVFMADVKGDLSGAGAAGVVSPKLQKRLDELGLEGFVPYANPVAFWDVFGQGGIPSAPRFPTWGRCCSPACSI
jgi:hypothetical protein